MGILRIHFGVADLSRTRSLGAPDPMWEIVCAVHRLQTPLGRDCYGSWFRELHAALARTGGLPAIHETLIPLVPRAAYFPDLLTPVPSTDLEATIDRIQHTGAARLRSEISRLDPPAHARPGLADLAAGRPAAIRKLGTALRDFYRVAVQPHQPAIAAMVARDGALRASRILATGPGNLLHDLGPTVHWAPPVLTVSGFPKDRDVHLGGRGITLVPSYFCWRYPITLADQGLPPVLVYPVRHAPDEVTPPAPSLAALLGRTRLSVLNQIRAGATTMELARRTGIAAATASEHATVLRNAGLIASHRHGNMVIHRVTDLGARLLGRR